MSTSAADDSGVTHQRSVHAETSETVISLSQKYSGPLPHPSELAAYDKILPGLADRIVRMTEEQGRHRRSMEKLSLKLDAIGSFAGQAFAMATVVSFILAAGYCAVNGHPLESGVLGMGALVPIVTVFIRGKSSPTPTQKAAETRKTKRTRRAGTGQAVRKL